MSLFLPIIKLKNARLIVLTGTSFVLHRIIIPNCSSGQKAILEETPGRLPE